jgi:hypothetical protein
MKKGTSKTNAIPASARDYTVLLGSIGELLDTSRRASARTVNSRMTATYWEIGRQVVEFEQGGRDRAAYGEELLKRLSADLSSRFKRGFGVVNLSYMKRFYLSFPPARIFQTLSEKSVRPSLTFPVAPLPCEGGAQRGGFGTAHQLFERVQLEVKSAAGDSSGNVAACVSRWMGALSEGTLHKLTLAATGKVPAHMTTSSRNE